MIISLLSRPFSFSNSRSPVSPTLLLKLQEASQTTNFRGQEQLEEVAGEGFEWPVARRISSLARSLPLFSFPTHASTMFITVTPYDPAWPLSFQRFRSSLSRALQDVEILRIEHVGSTSVPGLAAKPIIDIDIVTTRPNISSTIAALEKAGYVYEGEKGILDRHSFKAPVSFETSGEGKIKTHVYLCPEDSLALKNHLSVRDLLSKDQELRDEYGRVKIGLAEREVESIDEYVEGKSDILRKILGRAGLGLEELGEIESANKKTPPTS